MRSQAWQCFKKGVVMGKIGYNHDKGGASCSNSWRGLRKYYCKCNPWFMWLVLITSAPHPNRKCGMRAHIGLMNRLRTDLRKRIHNPRPNQLMATGRLGPEAEAAAATTLDEWAEYWEVESKIGRYTSYFARFKCKFLSILDCGYGLPRPMQTANRRASGVP